MKKMRKRFKLLSIVLAGCLVFTQLQVSSVQAAGTTGQSVKEKTVITGLTTNYQSNPLGIEIEGIRFGWQMDSTVIGAKQTAYQIKVLAEDGTSVWDSGKVESDKSTGIACEGTISERSVYRWEVTAWDQTGTAYNAKSSFETGVSNVQEWKDTEFICMNKSRFAPIFRTEKALTQKNIRKARLYITALGAYEAYVNGKRVGEWKTDGTLVYHHMNPGYGNANVSLGYQTYDVTPFLTGAESAAVAVNVGTGWYNGMGNTGTSSPAVKALLMIDYADGSSQVIKTNTTDWKGTLAGGITASGIYYGEDYNAIFAKELGDYTKVGYDDSAWVGPEGNGNVSAAHYDTEFGRNVTAKKVKISVSQVGPAVYEANDWEKENRLQIMELELWNGVENVAKNIVPVVSTDKPFEFGDTWRAQNLTDGDYGNTSDKGYTTDILDRQKTTLNLQQPITIEFDFAEAVEFSSMRIFPRSGKDSILGGIYANYPKIYTVSVSENGTDWTDLVTDEDKGMVRKQEDLQNMKMSTTTFPGVVRAQTGLPGRMTEALNQKPVSAVVYSGTKAQSEYRGGEIDTIAEYTGADMFSNGIKLEKGQTMVVNMGQNLTAVPNIRFSATCGTRAQMRFAEMLNDGSEVGGGATQADGPKGSIYQKSLRNARSQATYVFSGDGVEEYQPSMSFFGYQYVELTASDDMVIYGLTSKAISSVSEQLGKITTNNADVNKFFNNVLFGQLSNYYTAPTDCNQRDERLSWTGDTQAFAQTAVYNFNSYAFLQDMQEIFKENTKKNGYVASVTDSVNTTDFFGNWAVGWSDVLIIVPWVLYQQTGDIHFLEDNWDVLETYMTFLKGNERGVNQCWIPDNSRNYGDWLSFQGTSIEVINDYYYGYTNQIMAEIASILGKTDRQEAYQKKFESIKQTFLDTHVTFNNGNLVIKSGQGNKNYQFMYSAGKGGVWENNSQTSLLWMLKLGFYDSDEMKEAAEKLLIDNIRNENPDASSVRKNYGQNTLAVGFLGSNVIAPVLTDTGNPDVSYDLLLQDGQPSWLFEVKAGATTVWERWNSYSPGVGFGDSEMNSFNHYAYGSVVEWMYRYMAGISSDIKNPGFKHVILQPTLDTGTKYNEEERINSVDASYDSLYGRIESSWKSEGGKLAFYHTKIPANTTAALYLPVDKVDAQKLPAVSGITYKGMTTRYGQTVAEFELESGGYDFTVSGGTVIPSTGKGYGEEAEEKVSIEDCQIGGISTQYYNGKKKTLAVTVRYQGKTLVKNTDYTVHYKNNVNIGKAEITLTGKGTYTGSVTRTFTITVKKKASYAVGNYKYRITNAKTNGKGTVSLTGVKNSSVRKKLKKITVAPSVKIGGKNFKVTAIEKNAFKNCSKAQSAEIKANVTAIGSKAFYNCKKLKTLTVRSTKLKTVGKNALQKIHAKAVIQVPKSKLKTYQKKLKGKGQKKTVKIIAIKK